MKYVWVLLVLFACGCGGGRGSSPLASANVSWKAVPNVPITRITSMGISPGGVLYVGSNGGGGVARMPLNSPGSWTVLNGGLQPQAGLYCVMGFAFNSLGEALTGGSFCTGGPNGQYTAYPYRLVGNGTSWTVGNPGTPNWEAPVAQDGRGNVLMKIQGNSLNLGHGIFISTDGGNTYHPPTTNVVSSGIIFDIKLAPDNTTVYAAAELNGVFYSKDHGDNWSNLGPPPGQSSANTIAIGFAPDGTVLVSRESGQGV